MCSSGSSFPRGGRCQPPSCPWALSVPLQRNMGRFRFSLPRRAEGNRGIHTPSLVYLGRGLGVEILGLTSHDCEVSGSFLHRVTLSLIWGKQGHGNLGLAPQAGREEEQGLEWR